MPEPEVQQLHNIGPTVARWRVPDVIFFLYLSIVFCLGFPILPYALSFSFLWYGEAKGDLMGI